MSHIKALHFEYANNPCWAVHIVSSLVQFAYKSYLNPTMIGFTFTMIWFPSYYSLAVMIFISTQIDHPIGLLHYYSICSFQTNWGDLALSTILVCHSEELDALESVEAILASTVEEAPLKAYCQDKQDITSSWNIQWTQVRLEAQGLAVTPQWVSRRWEVERYLGIMEVDFWWCRRNCVTERRRRWKTQRERRDGVGIIWQDKEVVWGVATSDNVAWLLR